jgi:hypothetical protein
VSVFLYVVSGLHIFSVFPKYLAFLCLWYTPSLCVAYIICPTLFVVFNLSDNFSKVNSYTQYVYWKSHSCFFQCLLSLSLNAEIHCKFQSTFYYNITEQHSYFFLKICSLLYYFFLNNVLCFNVHFVEKLYFISTPLLCEHVDINLYNEM